MSGSRLATAPLADLDQNSLLALNNNHASELSWLTPERLTEILGQACFARGVAPMRAALIAFDQDSAYSGTHFAWFRARYPRFVYVDRIVVAPEARGQGFARALYEELFAAAGDRPVAAEVNSVPPNPASDAFHAAMGFVPVGEAAQGGKTVRYLVRELRSAPVRA